jgi:class 3 adenylate cyclase
VLAIFNRPIEAVMAAVDAQREMRNVQWGPTGRLQVRYGIHTGLTRARGDKDYFGPALPTATRLQSAAHADQILLSDVTVQRLSDDLERTPFRVSDLGEHHFKGIDPIRVRSRHRTCRALSRPSMASARAPAATCPQTSARFSAANGS